MDVVDEQLRIGLVGAGPWARRVHAPGIADHPGTTLTSVYSRRRERATELAQRYGAETAADLDELLSTVDAVAFAVPPAVQAELALRAAAAGKHLILDKPLAATLDGAQRLADAVQAGGLASIILLTRRFAPETRHWLDELNRLGDWAGGTATWLSGALLSSEYADSAWRHAEGALLDVGPHAIDLLDAALGEVTDVLAARRTPDDLWQLMLAHAGGAASTVTLSLRLALQPSLTELAVYGRHGYRALSGPYPPAQECHTALLDDFVALVHSGTTEHPCDARRGLHLQRVLDAAATRAA